jgi:hypothetical protein
MTTKTKRYVWACALLMMLTAPVAFITLPTVYYSPVEAAMTWTAALSANDLEKAAGNIHDYPYAYRREIMRVLSPHKRSEVWRGYIARYVSSHPAISVRGKQSLQDVMELFTPELFSGRTPSTETMSRLAEAAAQVKKELGPSDARILLNRLGPDDGEVVRLNRPSVVAFLQNRLLLRAQAIQCECATKSDWCDTEWHCHYFAGDLCYPDLEFPMCGAGWLVPCDGLCIPNH